MNKNTVIAFILILITIQFFYSKFYYEKILRKPYPFSTYENIKNDKKKENNKNSTQYLNNDTYTGISLISEKETIESEKTDTIWVETDQLIIGIIDKGARIISVKTKEYEKHMLNAKQNEFIDLVSKKEIGGINIAINNESLDSKKFTFENTTRKFRINGKDSLKLKFTLNIGNDSILSKIFTFYGEGYTIGLEITSDYIKGKMVSVGWLAGITEEDSYGLSRGSANEIKKVHLFDGKNITHIGEKAPNVTKVETGYYKWVTLTSKYFLIAMISESVKDCEIFIESYEENIAQESKKKQLKRIDYGMMMKRFAVEKSEKYRFYIGPSKLIDLKKQNLKLEKVLFSGWRFFFRADIWFPYICEFVLWLLIVLQKIVRDYGLVIIILTILSRIVTFPLTQSSIKSMNRMRELQPKINEIREKYKNDPKKMNQKMMEIYKKEGINPLNPGCLPMFLQMPVFIALFIVLQKAIELRGQGTLLIPWIKDLSKPEVLPLPFNPLPFEIPMYGKNIALLPIIMAILTYFQNKATIKDPNQKLMIYFMPIFMLVLFNNFPSGLVIYWTFSSAMGLAQQYWTDYQKRKNKNHK